MLFPTASQRRFARGDFLTTAQPSAASKGIKSAEDAENTDKETGDNSLSDFISASSELSADTSLENLFSWTKIGGIVVQMVVMRGLRQKGSCKIRELSMKHDRKEQI